MTAHEITGDFDGGHRESLVGASSTFSSRPFIMALVRLIQKRFARAVVVLGGSVSSIRLLTTFTIIGP